MDNGYAGTILHVDLSKKKITKHRLERSFAQKFVGGRGFNSKTLFDQTDTNTDPLGPENLLIFGVGPLDGTIAPSSNRYTVTAKSPLTGILGDANSGGFFGPEMKFAGYDQVVVKGKSERPVFILIEDEHVEIRDATHLWGKDTWTLTETIKKDLRDPGIKVAGIGPAGENLVKYASIMNDLARAAARCGLGAVMGSKMLKAIAVRGTKGVAVSDPKLFERYVREINDVMIHHPALPGARKYGTPILVKIYNEKGALPTRNCQMGTFEDVDKISGETLFDKYVVKSKSCFRCPIGCSRYYSVDEGPYAGTAGEGPEYETICDLGSLCGNSDLASILKINNMCNQLGLDTISTGYTIAFAMECYEKGLISKKDAEIELTWGPQTILTLLPKIAYREGIGDFLAEGTKRMAMKIGGGAERFAMNIKGLEPAAADPRGQKMWGLAFAVSTRGGDHLRALPVIDQFRATDVAKELFGDERVADPYSTVKKGIAIKWHEDFMAILDSLNVCKFTYSWFYLAVKPQHFANLLSAATGWHISSVNLLEIGERIVNVERAYLVREGIRRSDDTLPYRWLNEPMPHGPAKGNTVELDQMLDEYYDAREWDIRTGVPTSHKLKTLQLQDVVENLETCGIQLPMK